MCPSGAIKARRKAKLGAMKELKELASEPAQQVDGEIEGNEQEQVHEIAKPCLPPPPGLALPDVLAASSTVPCGQDDAARVQPCVPRRAGRLQLQLADSSTETGSDVGSDSTAAPQARSSPRSASAQGDSPMHHALSPQPQTPPSLTRADAELPSVGSIFHGTGVCKPCAWFWKPGGCQNGADCHHCHMCPSGAIKARRKAKLDAMKRMKETASEPSELVDYDAEAAEALEAQMLPPLPEIGVPEIHLNARGHQFQPVLPPPGLPVLDGVVASAQAHCSQDDMACLQPCVPGQSGQLQKQLADVCTDTCSDNGSESTAATETRSAPCNASVEGDSPMQRSLSPDVQIQPGLAQANAKPPSLGSLMHGTGMCKPCAWFWKPGGCQNGADCLHCHMCPSGAVKARRKAKLEAMKEVKELAAEMPKPIACDEEGEKRGHARASSTQECSGSTSVQPVGTSAGAVEFPTWCHPPGLPAPQSHLPILSCSGSISLAASLVSPLAETASAAAAAMQLPQIRTDVPLEAAPPVALELPSVGSWLHGTNACQPCAWFWKPRGCSNGKECQHCHLCDQGQLRSCRQAVRALEVVAEPLKEQHVAHQSAEQHGLQALHDPEEPCARRLNTFNLTACEPAYITGLMSVQQPFPRSCKNSEEGEPALQIESVGAGPDTHGIAHLPMEEPRNVPPAAASDDAAASDGDIFGVASMPPVSTLSVGSALHGTGRCKPCSWFNKPSGCKNGVDCQHCHACPFGEIKARRRAKLAGARLQKDKEQNDKNKVHPSDSMMDCFVVGGA